MHIFFIDESGNVPDPTRAAPGDYFVIAGIVIPDTVWPRLRNKLMGLKARYNVRGELKWRNFAPASNDPGNPLRGMDQATKNLLRTDIYSIIRSEKSVVLIACVSCVHKVYEHRVSVRSRESLYHFTYKQITERFQYYLQDLSRQVGRVECGIIVADHRGPKDDARFRQHHEVLLNSDGAEFTSKYGNLIESVFLQPSHTSVGIQLADMTAGAIWRRFARNDLTWFNHIEPSFRRSKSGDIDGYGIVKIPKGNFVMNDC